MILVIGREQRSTRRVVGSSMDFGVWHCKGRWFKDGRSTLWGLVGRQHRMLVLHVHDYVNHRMHRYELIPWKALIKVIIFISVIIQFTGIFVTVCCMLQDAEPGYPPRDYLFFVILYVKRFLVLH